MLLSKHDVVTHAEVDKEAGKQPTHIMYIVFTMRVATIKLYLFTRQSAKRSKLREINVEPDEKRCPRALGANIWISSQPTCAHSAPSKHACYAIDVHVTNT